MGVHPLLRSAHRSADSYRIRPAEYGFHVWRFRDWDQPDPGWRIIAKVSSREAGRQEILERLNLSEPVINITYQPMADCFVWDAWG